MLIQKLKNFLSTSTLNSWLHVPLKIISFVGLGPSDIQSQSKISYILYIIYSIIVFCISSLITAFHLSYIDWRKGLLDKATSFLLAIATELLQATLTIPMIIYSSRKNRFKNLIDLWKKYELDNFLIDTDKIPINLSKNR